MTMDHMNALFELAGAAFLMPSVLRAFRLRAVQGVHWLTPMFFWSWGLWNVVYYPSLGQWWSFMAGLVLVAVNSVWFYAVVSFTSKERPNAR